MIRMKYRRPWAKPAPKDGDGEWVWAFRPRNTVAGRKWMCWVWRFRAPMIRRNRQVWF